MLPSRLIGATELGNIAELPEKRGLHSRELNTAAVSAVKGIFA